MGDEKKVHRLEPQKPKAEKKPEQVLDLTKKEEIAFQPLVVEETNLEDAWDEPAVEAQQDDGGKGLRVAIGGVTALFVGCVIWAAVLLFSKGAQTDVAEKREGVTLSMEVMYSMRKKALRHYLTAPGLDVKSQFVRDRDRVFPLMLKHYGKHEVEVPKSFKVLGERPQLVNGKTVWNVHVELNHKRKVFIVESLEDGTAMIDWEADVAYQSTDIEKFKVDRVTEDRPFRVLIRGAQKNGFHGFEFADYNKYRCFQVNIPNSDDYFWAYTEIGTDLDSKWLGLLTQGRRVAFSKTKRIPVMVNLRFPENAQSSRCVHLGELLETGWSVIK